MSSDVKEAKPKDEEKPRGKVKSKSSKKAVISSPKSSIGIEIRFHPNAYHIEFTDTFTKLASEQPPIIDTMLCKAGVTLGLDGRTKKGKPSSVLVSCIGRTLVGFGAPSYKMFSVQKSQTVALSIKFWRALARRAKAPQAYFVGSIKLIREEYHSPHAKATTARLNLSKDSHIPYNGE